MKTANCPECDNKIDVQDESRGDPEIGVIRGMRIYDIVDCDECGSELEIMSLEPLIFEVVMMERHEENLDDNFLSHIPDDDSNLEWSR